MSSHNLTLRLIVYKGTSWLIGLVITILRWAHHNLLLQPRYRLPQLVTLGKRVRIDLYLAGLRDRSRVVALLPHAISCHVLSQEDANSWRIDIVGWAKRDLDEKLFGSSSQPINNGLIVLWF